MTITEKVAYIKGLAEGLSLDAKEPQNKLLLAIIDALDAIALEVSDLSDETEELNAYVEELDEDLGYVEEDLFGEDDCCECCCEDDDCCCEDDCCEDDCCEDDCCCEKEEPADK